MESLEVTSSVPGVIGINLDIPHWAFLGQRDSESPQREKIKVEDIDNNVLRRIVHAHISDHGRGHFCDDVIFSINQREAFTPWIRLLTKRKVLDSAADLPQDFPRYSGYVSNELEACKSREMIKESVLNSFTLGLKQ